MAKYVTKDFEHLPIKQCGSIIQKIFDFVDSVKTIFMQRCQILISFDICFLIQSLPTPQILECLRNLQLSNNLNEREVNDYVIYLIYTLMLEIDLR